MSAIIIIQAAETIYMLTDGATYDPDGTLRAVTQKVLSLAHLHAAAAARGSGMFLPIVAKEIGNFPSFDALLDGVVRRVGETALVYSAVMGIQEMAADFELYLAGWSSARQRPESYILTNASRHDGVPPWTLHELSTVAFAPFSPALEKKLLEHFAGGVDDRHPAEIGLEIMEAQRAVPSSDGQLPDAHWVGGFCQLTEIRRDSITTGILRYWPDEVGAIIDPRREAA